MNKFDSADYTILGKMSANMASAYRDALGQAVPTELLNEIARGDDMSYYVRRGFDNVVFNADLMLGVDYQYFNSVLPFVILLFLWYYRYVWIDQS